MSDRLEPSATQPLRASQLLSAEYKLVWIEDWVLDRGGEGCWLAHDQLAERLGMTPNAVQLARAFLVCCGLHERIKRPGARAPGWRSTLPTHCTIKGQRPTPKEVRVYRDFLDMHLRETVPEKFKNVPRTTLAVSGTDSSVLSTAFDSQGEKHLSTALGVEGNRVSAHAPEAKAVEDDGMRRGVLHGNGDSGSEPQFGKRNRTRDNRPLSPQERQDYLDGIDRDVRDGKLSPESAMRMRKYAT